MEEDNPPEVSFHEDENDQSLVFQVEDNFEDVSSPERVAESPDAHSPEKENATPN